jgi:FkbM family methyltransferase
MNTHDLIKNTTENIMYNFVPFNILKHVPQGIDLFYDLRKLNPRYFPSVVFDVGANIGQTVLKWNKFFPQATYHCFEPVTSTMRLLKNNTRKLNNVTYHPFALGDKSDIKEITIFHDSRLNTLQHNTADSKKIIRKEVIQITTVDEVCDRMAINQIDFLKIDTEGFDIEVLNGSASMLKGKRITFIQVEAGMNPFNQRHIPIYDFVDFLKPFGYILFGIYDQHLEWNGEKRLRMSNPVFIHSEAKF